MKLDVPQVGLGYVPNGIFCYNMTPERNETVMAQAAGFGLRLNDHGRIGTTPSGQ